MTAAQHTPGQAFLRQCSDRLDQWLRQIQHCINQLEDTQIWWRPRPEMNSIGNLLLHLGGNLRQWIVAGVQQLPDTRNRPQEFAERGPIATEELLRQLETVVGEVQQVLAGLRAEQLLETRRIQGFEETVLSALFGSLSHFAGHVQEIICLTRWQLGDRYQFAWKPQTPEQGVPVE